MPSIKRIYISDLDGTLLTPDAQISDFSRRNLINLIKHKVPITIASGRNITAMKNILGKIPFKFPVVEMNGGFISDYKTAKHLITNKIEHHHAEDIINLIQDYGFSPVIASFDGKKDHLSFIDLINDGMRDYYEALVQLEDERLRIVNSYSDLKHDSVISISAIGRMLNLLPLSNRLDDDHEDHIETDSFESYYFPGWSWLSIFALKATKDVAIKTFLEKENLHPEEIIVFGDSSNDLKMFEYATKAIAVANAKPDIKVCADQIIASNTEDGVIRYILNEEGLAPI